MHRIVRRWLNEEENRGERESMMSVYVHARPVEEEEIFGPEL